MNKGYYINHKNSGSMMIVAVVCLSVALIAALGWIFWQNVQNKQTVAQDVATKTATTVTQNEATPADANASTDTATRLSVKEWGITFKLPSSIKAIEYQYEAPSVFGVNGDSILVTSITTSDGRVLQKFSGQNTGGEVDAICHVVGVGRDSRPSVTNVSTGYPMDQLNTQAIRGYYYYDLTKMGGAMCGASTAAQEAMQQVQDMFDTVE